MRVTAVLPVFLVLVLMFDGLDLVVGDESLPSPALAPEDPASTRQENVPKTDASKILQDIFKSAETGDKETFLDDGERDSQVDDVVTTLKEFLQLISRVEQNMEAKLKAYEEAHGEPVEEEQLKSEVKKLIEEEQMNLDKDKDKKVYDAQAALEAHEKVKDAEIDAGRNQHVLAEDANESVKSDVDNDMSIKIEDAKAKVVKDNEDKVKPSMFEVDRRKGGINFSINKYSKFAKTKDEIEVNDANDTKVAHGEEVRGVKVDDDTNDKDWVNMSVDRASKVDDTNDDIKVDDASDKKDGDEIVHVKVDDDSDKKDGDRVVEVKVDDASDKKDGDEIVHVKVDDDSDKKDGDEVVEVKVDDDSDKKDGDEVVEVKVDDASDKKDGDEVVEVKVDDASDKKDGDEVVEVKVDDASDKKDGDEVVEVKVDDASDKKDGDEVVEVKVDDASDKKDGDEIVDVKVDDASDKKDSDEVVDEKVDDSKDKKDGDEVVDVKVDDAKPRRRTRRPSLSERKAAFLKRHGDNPEVRRRRREMMHGLQDSDYSLS